MILDDWEAVNGKRVYCDVTGRIERVGTYVYQGKSVIEFTLAGNRRQIFLLHPHSEAGACLAQAGDEVALQYEKREWENECGRFEAYNFRNLTLNRKDRHRVGPLSKAPIPG